jgi:hypothetical protein
MPARHRHLHSSERRKSFTITLESCSRSAGICVHDAMETVTTMSRNMQVHLPALENFSMVPGSFAGLRRLTGRLDARFLVMDPPGFG